MLCITPCLLQVQQWNGSSDYYYRQSLVKIIVKCLVDTADYTWTFSPAPAISFREGTDTEVKKVVSCKPPAVKVTARNRGVVDCKRCTVGYDVEMANLSPMFTSYDSGKNNGSILFLMFCDFVYSVGVLYVSLMTDSLTHSLTKIMKHFPKADSHELYTLMFLFLHLKINADLY